MELCIRRSEAQEVRFGSRQVVNQQAWKSSFVKREKQFSQCGWRLRAQEGEGEEQPEVLDN